MGMRQVLEHLHQEAYTARQTAISQLQRRSGVQQRSEVLDSWLVSW